MGHWTPAAVGENGPTMDHEYVGGFGVRDYILESTPKRRQFADKLEVHQKDVHFLLGVPVPRILYASLCPQLTVVALCIPEWRKGKIIHPGISVHSNLSRGSYSRQIWRS